MPYFDEKCVEVGQFGTECAVGAGIGAGLWSVGNLIEFWLENNVRGYVRDSSLANYQTHAKHIIKHLGNVPVTNLQKPRIQQFVSDLSNEDKLAPGTVRAVITTLSCLYKCAVDYDIVAANPCVKLKLPQIREKEVLAFAKCEQERLEKAIMEGDDYREIGVLICLYTGIRLGELCALKWDCLNIAEKMICIKGSIGRVKVFDEKSKEKTRIVESEPKTLKSKRTIPIPDFLCRILKSIKAKSKSLYILPSKNNFRKPIQPRTMQHVFKRLLSRSRLRPVNFHILRHTFATRSVELGADIKSLSEMLGHSNVNITMNRYAHSLLDQKRKIMSKMNAFFSNKKMSRIENDTGYNLYCVYIDHFIT